MMPGNLLSIGGCAVGIALKVGSIVDENHEENLDPALGEGAGWILGRLWTDIDTVNLSDLEHPDFPENADDEFELPYFEWNPATSGDIDDLPGDDFADNYGAQVVGYFHPPVDGEYVFTVNADDAAYLYLSTDATRANKQLIAHEMSWTEIRGLGRLSYSRCRYRTSATKNSSIMVD